MEITMISLITLVALVAWSWCLSRLTCPLRRQKRSQARLPKKQEKSGFGHAEPAAS
jgi:hypothetical protein